MPSGVASEPLRGGGSIWHTVRGRGKHVAIEVALAFAVAAVLILLLVETTALWGSASNALEPPGQLERAALALIALGVLVGLPAVWARVPPLTAAVAGAVLAAAVVPWTFQVGNNALPSFDGYLLKLAIADSTYVTIGILFAASLRSWLNRR
jgi:hypothetical protein